MPLFSHAVRTATQISAYFGSLTQLMLTCSSLFTIPIVGFKIILKIMAPELDATAIGSA